MKNKTILIAIFLYSSFAFAQTEGIQKGDNEITFNGMISSVTYGDDEFTSGSAFASYGRYFTKRFIVGIAPGATVYMVKNKPETTYSLQLFSNFNLAHNKPIIPYLRLVLYKFDLETEDTEFVQFGAGMKYFFAQRAAWDTLLTYGRGFAPSSGSNVLLLTGLSFIF